MSRVLSVVLMGKDTGHPHLLAPNLLTGGKRADLVIRGNVVLNALSALLYPDSWIRSAPTLCHAGRSLVLPNCPTRQASFPFVEPGITV
jgi:hypothetical protein